MYLHYILSRLITKNGALCFLETKRSKQQKQQKKVKLEGNVPTYWAKNAGDENVHREPLAP